MGLPDDEGGAFLKDKLREMAQLRSDLEFGLSQVDTALEQAKQGQLKAAEVRSALAKIGEVYNHLKPYEQRELIRLLLKQAEVGEEQIVLEMYALDYSQMTVGPEMATAQSSLRFEPPDWLREHTQNTNHFWRPTRYCGHLHE